MSSLLLIPSPFEQLYYSGVTMLASAADQKIVWAIDLADYVFMAVVTIVVIATDRVCGRYYERDLWLSYVSEGFISPF